MRKLWVLVFFCLFAGSAYGQSPNATVTGRVTDPGKDVIADAKVSLINEATNIEYSGTTNEAGNYYVAELPPGAYRIQVEKAGFKSVLKPGVVLHVQDALEVNFEMAIGSVTESVTVEAGVPQVELTSSSISGVVKPDRSRRASSERTRLDLPGDASAGRQSSADPAAKRFPGTSRNPWKRGPDGHRRNASPALIIIGSTGLASWTMYKRRTYSSVIGAALGVDAIAEFFRLDQQLRRAIWADLTQKRSGERDQPIRIKSDSRRRL